MALLKTKIFSNRPEQPDDNKCTVHAACLLTLVSYVHRCCLLLFIFQTGELNIGGCMSGLGVWLGAAWDVLVHNVEQHGY